ncbi:protein zwilch [Lutzomyia longipalpis]|uniref:protein zwilch n=1 Tax=Lutzomyia longipalpis TaxID=7200 RepID=UPI002483AC47|nr:protein zwilch [Lutzomyia longipalpis]
MDKFSVLEESLRDAGIIGDYSVIKIPSYLKKIAGIADPKILLLLKKVDSRKKSDDISCLPSFVDEGNTTNPMDLTGSPLKDECAIESLDISANLLNFHQEKPWDAIEECYRGIEQQDAIKILNLLGENIPPSTSIWALCPSENQNVLLMQKEFTEGFNSRGKVWFDGNIMLENINLSAVMKKHLSFCGRDEQTTMDIRAEFKLKNNVLLEHSWLNSKETTLMNTSTSACTLRQVLPVDSKDFAAEDFWRQLVILDTIAEEIIKYKKHDDKRFDPVYKCGITTTTITTLKEQIQMNLTELPMNFTDLKPISSENTVSSLMSKAHERDSLSVTDKLWDILKFAASYKDLKLALNFVFHSASENKILNTQTNTNHLAMLIDAVAHKELSIPCLIGSEPLELLLEIGLEKARKDYEYIFTESKICFPEELQLGAEATVEENQAHSKRLTSRKSLFGANHTKTSRATSGKSLLKNPSAQDFLDDNVMGFRNSHFNRTDVDYRLAKLAQIHLILEHLIQVDNLKLANLNQLITRNLLETPIVPFKSLNPTENYILNISVPNDQVAELTKFKRPNSLRIVMRSANKFKHVENTFYYTSEAIIPPETFPMNAENLSKVDEIDQNEYFVYRYLKIKTLNRCGM